MGKKELDMESMFQKIMPSTATAAQGIPSQPDNAAQQGSLPGFPFSTDERAAVAAQGDEKKPLPAPALATQAPQVDTAAPIAPDAAPLAPASNDATVPPLAAVAQVEPAPTQATAVPLAAVAQVEPAPTQATAAPLAAVAQNAPAPTPSAAEQQPAPPVDASPTAATVPAAEFLAPALPTVSPAPLVPPLSEDALRAGAAAALAASDDAAERAIAQAQAAVAATQAISGAQPSSAPEGVASATAEPDPILTNLTRTVLENRLDNALTKFHCCACEKCQLDVLAVALNRVPPHYIMLSEGEDSFAHVTPDLARDAVTALVQAILYIKAHPRH